MNLGNAAVTARADPGIADLSRGSCVPDERVLYLQPLSLLYLERRQQYHFGHITHKTDYFSCTDAWL